jgi:hypothetical protein
VAENFHAGSLRNSSTAKRGSLSTPTLADCLSDQELDPWHYPASSPLRKNAFLLNADAVQVLHGPHGTRAIFRGVVIGETAQTSYLREEVFRRLAGAPRPAGQPSVNRIPPHSGAAIWL